MSLRAGCRVAFGSVWLLAACGSQVPATKTDDHEEHDRGVEDHAPEVHHEESTGHVAGPRTLTAEDVKTHIGAPSQVQTIKAAALFLDGIESCVDGRDRHAVVGTPGGDIGELLLALAAVESWTGHVMDEAEIQGAFDAHLEAFGDFYMHTDLHAIEILAERLRNDPEFRSIPLSNIADVETFLRSPPSELQAPLLKVLLIPETMGCGHLRLMALDPEAYRVRLALLDSVVSGFFTRLWAKVPDMRYEILTGNHGEGAVVNVRLDEPVHPYTRIPLLEPDHHGTEMFVRHPDFVDWLREQRVQLLLQEDDWLRAHQLDPAGFLGAINELADIQLKATVVALAPNLPMFDVHISDDHVDVEGPVSVKAALAAIP